MRGISISFSNIHFDKKSDETKEEENAQKSRGYCQQYEGRKISSFSSFDPSSQTLTADFHLLNAESCFEFLSDDGAIMPVKLPTPSHRRNGILIVSYRKPRQINHALHSSALHGKNDILMPSL